MTAAQRQRAAAGWRAPGDGPLPLLDLRWGALERHPEDAAGYWTVAPMDTEFKSILCPERAYTPAAPARRNP